MSAENEQRNQDMDRIASYIKKLKFKKAVMGGIEPESAYQAMRELVSMFTEIYTAATEHTDELARQLRKMQDEQNTAETRIQTLKDQTAQHVEKLKNDTEAQYRKMEAENNTLKEQLRKESQSHSGEIESLQAENAELSEQAEELYKENDKLSAQLRELKKNATENEFQRETLEEIYLDANRRRMQILDTANADAQKLRLEANEANAQEKQRFDAKMKAWREEFEREKQRLDEERQIASEKFSRELAQAKAQMTAEEQVCHEHCEEQIKEAEEKALAIVVDAENKSESILSLAQADADKRKAETDALVVSAQVKYKAERARYDGMIRRLGEMRTEVLRSIQKDVNQLQSLAFHLSGSGIEAETETITGIDELNELQKAAERSDKTDRR